MVFSTAPLDLAGGLTAIRPFVHKLLLFLKKKSEKKKVTDKLFNGLKATERMDKAIGRLEASGKTFRELAESSTPPLGIATADKMYLELVNWMQAISEVILAQQALSEEAVVFSHYETIMEDLKRLDRDLFEFVNMLVRSNKDGKIDPMEFATFASIYAPKESEQQMGDVMETTVKPIAEKAKAIGQTLPFPNRARIPAIKRAYLEMQEAQKCLGPLNEDTRKRLLQESPGWMTELSEILEDVMASTLAAAISRLRIRAPSPQPPGVPRNKFPRKAKRRRKGF